METLYVSLSAFGGGLASAVLGWLHSGQPFEHRKFATSFLRAVLAGSALAGTYAVVGEAGIQDIIIAFGAGAGVETLGHKVASVKQG